MTRLKNSLGFSAVEALLILAIIGILGFTGWFVRHSKQVADKTLTANNSTAPTFKKKAATGANPSSQKTNTAYTLDAVDGLFSYPSDWSTLFTYPNGVALKSPGFQSSGGFSKISDGSTLSVAYSATKESGTDESLTTLASVQANGTPASSKFITVGGQRAIEFSHSAGENRNQHVVVLFIKDGQEYVIEQQFSLNAQNPYPDLVSNVVSGFKFSN